MTKTSKTLAVMQGLRPLFLLRCRLAPKQASANRHRRRNSLRSSGLPHSKENLENRLARCLVFRDRNWELKVTSRQPVFKVFLCGSAKIRRRRICHLRLEGGERRASHKPSNRKWQRALALGADTKRFSWFLLKSYLPCATTSLTNYRFVNIDPREISSAPILQHNVFKTKRHILFFHESARIFTNPHESARTRTNAGRKP